MKHRKITLQQLRDAGACRAQVELFKRLFGAETTVTVAKARRVAARFNWDWACAAFLSRRARDAYQAAAYHAAIKQAQAAYNAAIKQAQAIEQARDAYHAAIKQAQAIEQGRDAYQAAVEQAVAAYHAAIKQAQAAYNAAKAEAWARAYLADA